MRVDHVAIAVNNVDQAIKNYQKVLNSDRIEVEIVESEKVKPDAQRDRFEIKTSPSAACATFAAAEG